MGDKAPVQPLHKGAPYTKMDREGPRPESRYSQLEPLIIWVVVKTRVPFGVPKLSGAVLRAQLYGVAQRDHLKRSRGS